jgi:hypothetical protein
MLKPFMYYGRALIIIKMVFLINCDPIKDPILVCKHNSQKR